MALSQNDVVVIRAIRKLSEGSKRDAAYWSELRALEGSLSVAGSTAYMAWTRDKMSAELRRWRPVFRIEATQAGYRVLRWIGARREYAKRPTAARLLASDLTKFEGLVRC